MTPTATYIASEKCLQLLPHIEEPAIQDYAWQYEYDEAYKKYNTHLATLRKIPCSPECKGLWADQQKVVEGVDYEVKFVYEPGQSIREVLAFPLVPVKSEDEFQKSIDEMDEDSKLFVDKSMAIANRISELLENKGLKQKDLAAMMGKTDSEISRMLAGMQNLTLRMISKVEAVLGEEIISITH